MLGVVCCQYRDMHNLEHNSCYLCCLFDIHSNIYFSCIIEFIWVPWIYRILDYLVLFLRFLADRLGFLRDRNFLLYLMLVFCTPSKRAYSLQLSVPFSKQNISYLSIWATQFSWQLFIFQTNLSGKVKIVESLLFFTQDLYFFIFLFFWGREMGICP